MTNAIDRATNLATTRAHTLTVLTTNFINETKEIGVISDILAAQKLLVLLIQAIISGFLMR